MSQEPRKKKNLLDLLGGPTSLWLILIIAYLFIFGVEMWETIKDLLVTKN